LFIAGVLMGAVVPGAGVAWTPVLAQEQQAATAECPRLIVPAYFDPGPEWERVIAAAPAVEYVILNPNSGPGEAPDPALIELVRRAQEAGIKVVGYVYTDIGNEDPDVVKAQVRAYQEWYGVDGIHLDGVHNEARFIPYYRDIAEVIREGGQPGVDGGEDLPGIVILNPGYVPDEGYMEIADIIEVYEYFYDRYPGQDFPDWIEDYPAARFAHVILDAPADEQALEMALALAEERNAGYVFVTDQQPPSEYRVLPSFWDAQVDATC